MKIMSKTQRRVINASVALAAMIGAQVEARAEAQPIDPVGALIHKVAAEDLAKAIDIQRLQRDAIIEKAGKHAPTDLLRGIDLRIQAKADMRPALKTRTARFQINMP